ncbi:MAG TPA: hydroxyphenylacetyl-CoA thioesterase PaaI [Balneolales bacterium]|nr:hydroxyphenylacetyl-CoA thioesterase PaaI [Balneolales bacterium]
MINNQDNEQAQRIVQQMMEEDAFSRWLGIEIIEIAAGKAVLKMKIRDEMLNGFKLSHGGIVFSLADSALAFASNSRGRPALALENNISYFEKIENGDELTAVATELNLTNRTGTYQVEVTNQNNTKVAFFKGTVYRTPKEYLKSDNDKENNE